MIIACVNGSRRRGEFNMDDLEIYWCVQFIIFSVWFSKTSLRNKIIALTIILLVPSLGGPFITTGLLILNMLTLGYVNCTNFAINHLFNTCLTPIFSGNLLPLKPTIIIANYPTNYIEYLANHLLCDRKICFVVKRTAPVQSIAVRLFYHEENILFVSSKGSFEDTQDIIEEKIQQGYTIFTYIDKTYFKRPTKYAVHDIRRGIFTIAKNLGVPITPMVFDHIDHSLGILEQTTFKIFTDETRFVRDIDEEMEKVHNLFKRKLKTFKIK